MCQIFTGSAPQGPAIDLEHRSRGRLQPGRQLIDVSAIAEHAATLPMGDFTDDADALQMRQRLVDRGRCEPRGPDQRRRGGDRLTLQRLVYGHC